MSLKYDELRGLLSRSVLMVRDFLMEEVYHDSDVEELSIEWDTTVTKVMNLTAAANPATHDLLELLNLTSLDYGIAIRDPATGKEVTFFAANNLASDIEYDQQTEEIVRYDPISTRDSGLDFLPKVHLYGADGKEILDEIITEVDGDFNLDDIDVPSEDDIEEEIDEPIQEAPGTQAFFDFSESDFEEDPAFDVVAKIGEDVIEAEFQELTPRDVIESQNDDELCENCIEGERLPDSMLCHFCTMAGVECNPPEDPERPEDYEPLELLAVVNHHARHAEFQSRRLLRAGKLLMNKE